MKKKTEYALITQEQFATMRAAIQEYYQQHANQQQGGVACGCRACVYAEQANVSSVQTFAPIFIPHDIPWHEEET